MRKLTFFIIIMIAISLLLTACGGKTADAPPEEVTSPNVANDVAPADDPIKEEEDITDNEDGVFVNPFANNNNNIDYYYEVEVISNEQSDFTKFWVSGNKSRMELVGSQTQDNVISISDGDEKRIYHYSPTDNTVMIRDYLPIFNDYDKKNYIESMKALFDDVNDVKVEKGTFDDQPVQILTGNMHGNKNIIWLSTKTRFPLKSEYYQDGKVAHTTLFKNFKIGPVDQSVFKVPAGATVTD